MQIFCLKIVHYAVVCGDSKGVKADMCGLAHKVILYPAPMWIPYRKCLVSIVIYSTKMFLVAVLTTNEPNSSACKLMSILPRN